MIIITIEPDQNIQLQSIVHRQGAKQNGLLYMDLLHVTHGRNEEIATEPIQI